MVKQKRGSKYKPWVKPKAIGYARFSPRRDEDTSESIEYQEAKIAEWCEQNGYELLDTFSDVAMSGDVVNRPGLWTAILALRKGYALVSYSLDRLSRDMSLAMVIEADIKSKGCKIISVLEPVPEPMTEFQKAMNEAQRQLLWLLAQISKAMTRAKTSDAMKRHQASGRAMSYLTPYGWKRGEDRVITVGNRVVKQRTLMPDPDEQAIREIIFGLYRSGMGYQKIARTLDEDGYVCRDGKSWLKNKSTVKAVLKRAGLLRMDSRPTGTED